MPLSAIGGPCTFAEVDSPLSCEATLDHTTSLDLKRLRRYGVRLPCHVRPRRSGKNPTLPELELETLDVGGSGFFFLPPAQLTMGAAIEFELDLPGKAIRRPESTRYRGTVTRVVPQERGSSTLGLPSITTRSPH
jgi:hypothetical protein